MDLLSDKLPTSYSRAAAFTISRLLAPTDTPSHQAVISIHISELLHSPFLWQHKNDAKLSSPDAITSEDPNRATASRALSNIIMLMSNTDPSPMFITNLLSPIVPELYSLLYHMDRSKLSDPILKESLRSILVTWGKICSAPEGVDVVWRVVDGEGGESHWQVDADGQILKLHMWALFTIFYFIVTTLIQGQRKNPPHFCYQIKSPMTLGYWVSTCSINIQTQHILSISLKPLAAKI